MNQPAMPLLATWNEWRPSLPLSSIRRHIRVVIRGNYGKANTTRKGFAAYVRREARS